MERANLDHRLRKVINKIKDENLRLMVLDFFRNPSIEIDGRVYKGLPIRDSPASISRHHNYPGGLLEHILSTTKIALAMCDSVEEVYHGNVSRDLVISGILLHDILKPFTYSIKDDGAYRSSSLGERIDHLTLIASELIRKGFPQDLIHIACSHHGEAGAITPKTVEALICHLADVADSSLNGEVLRAAKYLIAEVRGMPPKKIDSKKAFLIVYSKAIGGWDGLRKILDEMGENSVE